MLQKLEDCWYRLEEDTFEGNGVTTTVFRVIDRETSEPVDGRMYVEALVKPLAMLVDSGQLQAAAVSVYRPIAVEVSVLEDTAAIPQNMDEDAVVDLWTSMHLALMLRLDRTVSQLLAFHGENAVAAMAALAQAAGEPTASSLASTAEGLRQPHQPLECVQRGELGGFVALLGSYEPRLSSVAAGGRSTPEEECTAALRNEQMADLEEELLMDAGESYCMANIVTALKPLIVPAVQYIRLHRQPANQGPPAATDPPRPATHVEIRHPCFAIHCIESHGAEHFADRRRPMFAVGSAVVYDACGGDPYVLQELLRLFEFTLAPIFRGKKLVGGVSFTASGTTAPSTLPLSRTNSGPVISTPRLQNSGCGGSTASNNTNAPTSGGHCAGSGCNTAEPIWLSGAPQDVARVAMDAFWLSCREHRTERPTGERHRQIAGILHGYRTAMTGMKLQALSGSDVPPACTWSGHMLLTAKLISTHCTVEDLLDFISEEGYLTVLASTGVPGAVVALMAAGVAASTAVWDPVALRLLTCKVDSLLVDVNGRSSVVRTYTTGRPATHAERFEELWIGETPWSAARKFKTRADMLYFAVVELVLLSAEHAWQQAGALAASTEKPRAEAVEALEGYIRAWRAFFVTLWDRPVTLRRSRSRSCSSDVRLTPRSRHANQPPSPLPTVVMSLLPSGTANASTPGSGTATPLPHLSMSNSSSAREIFLAEETAECTETAKKLCTALSTRLEHGAEPLPQLHAALYTQGPDLGPGGGAAVGSSGTAAHTDRSLPVSSLDSEFAYIQQCFAESAAKASNEVKLKFYGLFKQATVGDINVAKPWFVDTVGVAKWSAWKQLQGMSLVDAKRTYINEYKAMKAAAYFA